MDRFLSKVRKTEGCWEWRAAKNQNGYGVFGWKGRMWLAHRWAMAFLCGEDVEGTNVCHSCDNPGCVNPDHLWLGTQKDNMADMTRKGRRTRGETHPNTKLSDSDVEEIRQRYAAGETQASIGKVFGVSQSCVSNIVSKRRRSA